MKNIKILLLTAALLLGVFGIFSCTSATSNQDAIPHEITQKVISELGITPEQFNGVEENAPAIPEYYSEADEDFQLDDFMMMTTFPLTDKEYGAGIFDKYSVVTYNRTSKFPFEIVILKLPLADGKVDAEILKDAQNLCNEKLKSIKKWISEYAPEYVSVSNKTAIITTDNYVYYVIAEDYAKAEQIIKDALAAK